MLYSVSAGAGAKDGWRVRHSGCRRMDAIANAERVQQLLQVYVWSRLLVPERRHTKTPGGAVAASSCDNVGGVDGTCLHVRLLPVACAFCSGDQMTIKTPLSDGKACPSRSFFPRRDRLLLALPPLIIG